MSEDFIYQGKSLASMDLWALGLLLSSLTAQENKRKKASEHKKFNDHKTNLKLPPINPEFTKLKNAVELAIRKKQTNV